MIALLVAWTSTLLMVFFFALFWINGTAWIGEDNLVIRSIESVLLIFSLVYFSIFLVGWVKHFLGR